MEHDLDEYFSISYFESVSGEELNPYNRLSSGIIKSFWAKNKYQAIFHKNIPIKTIGIEFLPEYCDNYLIKKFGKEYINPRKALLSVDEKEDFPEIVMLLYQLLNYRGKGISAKLFYEGKVFEALSLIYDRYVYKIKEEKNLSKEDREYIKNVNLYINDHYSFDLTLDKLSKIACMGLTKLKKTFKMVNKCTITEYIQRKRVTEAQHLLMKTDLNVGQIANIVGYKSASRFSELFKKNTGIRPADYRRLYHRS